MLRSVFNQPNNALLEAERLILQGEPEAAIAIAAPLQKTPIAQPAVESLLGRAYKALGETDRSLAHFQSAATLSDEFDRWRQFVVELLKADQKGRARRAASRSPFRGKKRMYLLSIARSGLNCDIANFGGVPSVRAVRMQELVKDNRLEEARQMGEQLMALHPQSAFVGNLLGIVAASEEKLDEAEALFRKAYRISPDHVGLAINLAEILFRTKKPKDALSILTGAAAANPRSIDLQSRVARAQLNAGQFDRALRHAKLALAIDRTSVSGLETAAQALCAQGLHDQALAFVERLLDVRDRPEDKFLWFEALVGTGRAEHAFEFARALKDAPVELKLNAADLLAEDGKFEAAKEAIRACIKTDQETNFSYLYYGSYGTWSAADPLLHSLRDLTPLVACSATDAARHPVYFARAKAEMDLGNDAEVFPALEIANTLQAKTAKRAPDDVELVFKKLTAAWTPESVDALNGTGTLQASPIFVVGMPRSGSTLLERILTAHANVTSVGEYSAVSGLLRSEPIPPEREISQAANASLKAITERVGRRARYLDKDLSNFERIGMLATVFPKARFVQIDRDPRAIALSIYANAMVVEAHPYSTDLEAIAERICYCNSLMAHWCCLFPDRIIRLSYDDLVADPESNIRALLSRLDLGWDENCLYPEMLTQRVTTLSFAQVRTGINGDSVHKWRRFERELAPVSKRLRTGFGASGKLGKTIATTHTCKAS